ncbi:MAG: GAF domain-containing protein [Candidatus Methylacidiphilales bacterium]
MSIPELNRLDALMDPEELLRRILELAVRRVGATSGSLMLLNPNSGALDIEVSVGLARRARQTKLKLGEGITGYVATTGRPERIDDVRLDRRYVELDPRIRSELAVPLLLRDQVVGIINLDSTRPAAFSSEHEKSLISFAETACEWIRLSWEINQLRRKGDQLETLVDMGQVIISQHELQEVLQRITRDSLRLMKARLCSLMLLSADGDELILKAWAGASGSYIRRPHLRVSESLVGVVVRRMKPRMVLNVQENQHYQQTELARREGLVSLLAVPLVFQDKPLGVLSVYTGTQHRFANDEIRLLTALAGLSAVAIAKARMLESVVEVEERLKATERLSALGWLAAEIAHEIRNPLTVVQMLFHSMTEDLVMDASNAKDAQLIAKRLKHMDRILEQILTFSRSAEPELDQLNAEDVLEDLSLLVRLKLNEQKIELIKQIESPSLLFQGDRAQVEQAILNLVLNACQAMSPGGNLVLRARTVNHRGRAMISLGVKDSGKGMTAKQKEALFSPFLSGRKGGTGLGLALVKKTLDGHGGEIVVRSRKGSGTTIELLFPAV